MLLSNPHDCEGVYFGMGTDVARDQISRSCVWYDLGSHTLFNLTVPYDPGLLAYTVLAKAHGDGFCDTTWEAGVPCQGSCHLV